MKKTRVFAIAVALILLLAAAGPPHAMASGAAAGAPLVSVTAMPGFVINGDTVTLRARCSHPSAEPISEAGFYVGDGGAGMARIVCAEAPPLSSGDSADFTAQAKLSALSSGVYKAFVVCGGKETVSGELSFDARPPLPPPAISFNSGATVTIGSELSWESVEGAACYAVKLQDVTEGSYLLGRASGSPSEAYYWVPGDMSSVPSDSYQLVSGHKYRLTVASAYDQTGVYGNSVDFTALSASAVKQAALKVTTGPYGKNDGGLTLHGSVDTSGLRLAGYGFLAGKKEGALKRMPMDKPEEFTGGAYSMTVSTDGADAGVYYYRAYAAGENGVEKLGSLQKVQLGVNGPFAPSEKKATISSSYVKKLNAIDPGWAFSFIKIRPYDVADTGIELLNEWERDHLIKDFEFPGMDITINKGAVKQFEAASRLLTGTSVKLVYKDGSVSSFMLGDLVDTAYCYNSRYIYPTTASAGGALLPDKWRWSLSLHSWGVCVDINARVQVNGQRGINFYAIKDGAVRLRRLPGVDSDGAVVLAYDGYPRKGSLVPDDVLNYILYELAFKPAGFYWGAYFGNNRTDPMHFTLIEAPARKDIPLREAKELPNG